MKVMARCLLVWFLVSAACWAEDLPSEYSWLVDEGSAGYLSDPLVAQATGRQKARCLGLLCMTETPDPGLIATNSRVASELFRFNDPGDSAALEEFLRDRELWGRLEVLFKTKGAPSVNWLVSRYPNADIQMKGGIVRCMRYLRYREAYAFLRERLDETIVVPNAKAASEGEPDTTRICDTAYSGLVLDFIERGVQVPVAVTRTGTYVYRSIEERNSSIAAMKDALVNDPILKVAVTNVPSITGQ